MLTGNLCNLTLSVIQIDTQADPDCAIVWLHGLGASGDDVAPVVEQLDLPASMRVRFIFPHAPVRAVSLNNGMRMPAWYDIYGLDMDSREDREGIVQATTAINALVRKQVDAGMQPHRVALAGFSQGGALALYAGLHCPHRLAGVLVLSGYLPLHRERVQAAANTRPSVPVFMAHGRYDDVVPIACAHLACELLTQQGLEITWREYPCAHTMCAEEIADIRAWLLTRWQ